MAPIDSPAFYLVLVLAGFLPTEVWRWLGLVVGANLDVNGALFQWVRAVATTIVAGLVSRLVLFPVGALANVPLAIRIGAFAGGIAIYFLVRRNLAAGVAGGAGLMMLAAQLAGP